MSYSAPNRDRTATQAEKREMAQLRASLLAAHQGLNESNDIIAAERYEDLEKLRVYSKLLGSSNWGKDGAIFITQVLSQCVLMLRRLGYTDIDQFLTRGMVHSLYLVNNEVGKVYTENSYLLFPDASDDVMRLVLDDISKAETITLIIRERKLTEAREIKAILATMSDSHSAVVSGAL